MFVSVIINARFLRYLLQTENATLEFRNPRLERLVALTAADRKWMDEIVRDVNDTWDDRDPLKPAVQYEILKITVGW